ncbi:hypothetical protein [Paraburkholderia sp. DHOC27]|uniref:hypothetical protein n=1 Tax=Paraburkholderia sp. DHOC27 TaxID=2303330 RepID=UPI000E3DAFD0|nr:hypothetical protein [Paraburkholderia sp. DHOC27]RFU48646.1 hypothetical protein D0B32_02065 [Paraburkholderia sp. DHOC27]
MATYTTSPVGLPWTQTLGNDTSGTITALSCPGQCVCTVYSAAGVVLASIDSRNVSRPNEYGQLYFNIGQPYVMPLNLAFSGGAPYVVQRSGSSISFTI